MTQSKNNTAMFNMLTSDLNHFEAGPLAHLEQALSTFCEAYEYDEFTALVDSIDQTRKALKSLLKSVSVGLDPHPLQVTPDEVQEIGERLEIIVSNFDYIAATVRGIIDTEMFELKMLRIASQEV